MAVSVYSWKDFVNISLNFYFYSRWFYLDWIRKQKGKQRQRFVAWFFNKFYGLFVFFLPPTPAAWSKVRRGGMVKREDVEGKGRKRWFTVRCLGCAMLEQFPRTSYWVEPWHGHFHWEMGLRSISRITHIGWRVSLAFLRFSTFCSLYWPWLLLTITGDCLQALFPHYYHHPRKNKFQFQFQNILANATVSYSVVYNYGVTYTPMK